MIPHHFKPSFGDEKVCRAYDGYIKCGQTRGAEIHQVNVRPAKPADPRPSTSPAERHAWRPRPGAPKSKLCGFETYRKGWTILYCSYPKGHQIHEPNAKTDPAVGAGRKRHSKVDILNTCAEGFIAMSSYQGWPQVDPNYVAGVDATSVLWVTLTTGQTFKITATEARRG